MTKPNQTIPVIFDTDIGSDVDDTWALAYLLRCPELDARLVLTTGGDTRYRAAIAARTLEIAGRTDVDLALGGGRWEMADRDKHQLPWVADYRLDGYPGRVHEDGVGRLIEIVRASDEPVTIITVGPATSVADALERAPDIAARCRFVGMFGSVDVGYGPGSAPVAEANVKSDPKALRRVLAAPWRAVLLTPLDTCGLYDLRGEQYAAVRDSDDPLARAVLENYRVWARRVPWMTVDFEEERSSTLFDIVAVYLAFSTRHIEMDDIPLRVTDDGFTRRAERAEGTTPQVAIRWTDLDAFRADSVRRLLDRTPSTAVKE